MTPRLHLMALLCLLLSLSAAGAALASAGTIALRDDGRVWREQGDVRLSIHYDIHPGEAVARAIDYGIKLSFKFEIEYRQAAGWPWKRRLESASQQRVLRYLPLSRQYEVLTEHRPLERYDSLAGAMAYLGSYEVETTGDDITGATFVRTRLSLDRSNLPIPLRNRAYLDTDWHLDSGWKAWTLTAD